MRTRHRLCCAHRSPDTSNSTGASDRPSSHRNHQRERERAVGLVLLHQWSSRRVSTGHHLRQVHQAEANQGNCSWSDASTEPVVAIYRAFVLGLHPRPAATLFTPNVSKIQSAGSRSVDGGNMIHFHKSSRIRSKACRATTILVFR